MRVRRLSLSRYAGSLLPAVFFLLAPLDASAQQIILGNTRGLDFGRFVASTGGTVVLSPAGLRSRTGAVILLNSPAVTSAAFGMRRATNGGADKAVIISLPSNNTVKLSSGANSMAVNNFVSTPATLSSLPAGNTTLAVGATLTVAPNQAPGTYSGSFPVIVNFQ